MSVGRLPAARSYSMSFVSTNISPDRHDGRKVMAYSGKEIHDVALIKESRGGEETSE